MQEFRKNTLLENLLVTDLSIDGRGVAKHNGMVVFINSCVPGDIVDVQITKNKKSFAEARLVTVKKESGDRVKPICEHFGTCGGCKWQNLDYRQQLVFKERYVQESLSRIGKVQVRESLPILANKEPYYYRNKLEFSFSNKRWLTNEEMDNRTGDDHIPGLGYHLPGRFDRVLDIRNCYLQPEPSNSIRNWVKAYAVQHGITFYDIRNRNGMLRTLMLRNTLNGEWMVVIAVFELDVKLLFPLLDGLLAAFPLITSLQYIHNAKANDTFEGLDIKTYKGKDHIVETMEGLSFKISARSFYQTNPRQAEILYQQTRAFANLSGNETVYDLYTGTGTIANYVARQSRKVVGIEYVEDAVNDARENSRENHISNTVFYAGDMKDVLSAGLFAKEGRPDVVITDPPRAGMHEDVVKALLNAGPERVVYVSCNPATQARDLAWMDSHYEVLKVQPVDMFPQTTHVESIALLAKRV